MSDGGEPDGTSGADSGEPQTSAVVTTAGDTTVIARTVARVVVPVILLTSLSLLFQGHNLPGGGFIGGVLTATAFALIFIVYGLAEVREEVLDLEADRSANADGFVAPYRYLFSVGLALAAGSGLVPVFLDEEFLKQGVLFLKGVPLYYELEVASAFAFDLGVYFVVVGGLLTILGRVGQE